MIVRRTILLLSVFFALSSSIAFAQQHGANCPALGPKAVIGAATGGAVGAGIGAAATRGSARGAMLGGLLGAVTGAAVGSALDQHDCQQAEMALKQMGVTQTGQQIAWSNPSSGNHGYFSPTANAKQATNGQICRPYQGQTTMASGRSSDTYGGVVCRNADGDWVAQ